MTSNIDTSAPVFHVRYRYGHHAPRSGYDRLSDFVGEPVRLSRIVSAMGETLLRLPAKLVSWYGGSFEYSRHDFVMECQALIHMARHRGAIYHFLYGEKSFKLLAGMHGRRGHRLVASFHHPPEHYAWLFRSTDHLRRLDHAVALSKDQAAFLEGIVGRGRVTFIPHGVDTSYFVPAAPPARDRLVCLFSGTHLRDHRTLGRVVEQVVAARADVEFRLVSWRRECKAIARLPRVRWMPNVSDEDYLRLIQAADLLVLPLEKSVAVNGVLEALSCGVPVVTTAGGVSDYLDPSSSIATAPADAAGMSAAVLDILADTERRTAMREAARRHSLHFDWTVIARQMAGLYDSIAARG